MEKIRSLNSDDGMVLVVSLLVLVLLSLMGRAVTMTSSNEMVIAGNDRFDKMTFFAAEAGLGHIRGLFQSEFTSRNQAKIASGQGPDWNFALNGSVAGVNSVTAANFDGGSKWIIDCPLDDGARLPATYTVTVWNNSDDMGGATDDSDQLLCVRSVASGPRGTQCSVEGFLLGQVFGEAVSGYFAQASAGAGSNNNSRDVCAISDFSVQ